MSDTPKTPEQIAEAKAQAEATKKAEEKAKADAKAQAEAKTKVVVFVSKFPDFVIYRSGDSVKFSFGEFYAKTKEDIDYIKKSPAFANGTVSIKEKAPKEDEE